MSLTDTINNTNKQKENVKIVAAEIDNKLVELGGERATDLADVVNKMENAVAQRKKVAKFTFDANYTNARKVGPGESVIKKINTNFTPNIIFVSLMQSFANIQKEDDFNRYKKEMIISNTREYNKPFEGGVGSDVSIFLEFSQGEVKVKRDRVGTNLPWTVVIKEIICIG